MARGDTRRDARERELRFSAEFVRLNFNGTQAAIAAGYSARTAGVTAAKLLIRPRVQAEVTRIAKAHLEHINLDAENLTRLWSEIVTTDRNELAEIRRVGCRYCHGDGFEFQETPAEYRMRWGEHQRLLAQTPEKDWHRLPEFDAMGGVGYNANAAPHPDCPECFGDGVERIVIKDTRKLSPQAKAVFEGVDVKNGIPVVTMFSRQKASELLARRLGILQDKAGPPPPPAAPAGVRAGDDAIEAVDLYRRMIEGG